MYHISIGLDTFADPVFDRVDGVIYRIGGVDPKKGMNWKQIRTCAGWHKRGRRC